MGRSDKRGIEKLLSNLHLVLATPMLAGCEVSQRKSAFVREGTRIPKTVGKSQDLDWGTKIEIEIIWFTNGWRTSVFLIELRQLVSDILFNFPFRW